MSKIMCVALRQAILVISILLTTISSNAVAQENNKLTWSGTQEVDFFDCKSVGVIELVISGTVDLVHSETTNPYRTPQKISVRCNKLTFLAASKISTISALDIRIGEVASGPIHIVNMRGQRGEDGNSDPAILSSRKMASGDNGANGGNGKNALCRFRGLKFVSEASTNGGAGAHGKVGQSGHEYAAPKGAAGRAGSNAAPIIFVARQFAPETSVTIEAVGGDGGMGGEGGRGADGGDGGNGGQGGKGGNAASCRTASNGGNGGNGANGGDGGNGGEGGNGGDGGDGGDVAVFWQVGGLNPVFPIVTNQSGTGGLPGAGGQPGNGGLGGNEGKAGCGGSGSSGVLGDIDRKGGGKCAGAGVPGKPGNPGARGPNGAPGEDGRNGEYFRPSVGPAPKDKIDALIASTG